MAEAVLIYGKSGSGKSRSMINFAEDEILLVNVCGKRQPFKKQFKYVYNSDNYENIKAQLFKMPCMAAVIDDAGYLMSNEWMSKHSKPKSGSSSFDIYNEIADHFYDLLVFIKNCLPPEKIVYIILHEESNDYGDVKLRTIGKLLDQKVCIEGMVTICLRCVAQDKQHMFSVQSNGQDISKSPEDMFETATIPNDLKFVDMTIREYYNFPSEPTSVCSAVEITTSTKVGR